MVRIVVIDDDAAMAELVREIVCTAGHEVALAASGAEGIALVERERPDLVLCDVDMPDLDGFGVLSAVRAGADTRATPFLFLTGRRDPSDVRSGMNLGADDYLVKPIVPSVLLAAIEARLARAAVGRQDSNRRLEEMQRRMAVLLPHELRTPLTAILGGACLLREARAEMPPAEVDELLDAMVAGSRRLERLIENYLMYAGLELTRLAGEHPAAVVEGSAAAEHVEEAGRAAAREAGREADARFDLQELVIPLSPAYLRKMVSELMDNAAKFSQPGSEIRVSLRSDDGPRIDVVDAGRGMTAAQAAEVGAFRQFDRALFEQQGSGLGLALVRGLAVASGGRLEIDSKPGAGTCVSLRWPA